jgi:hypothetical protein
MDGPVSHIEVVARAALHEVGIRTAVEKVFAKPAHEGVAVRQAVEAVVLAAAHEVTGGAVPDDELRVQSVIATSRSCSKTVNATESVPLLATLVSPATGFAPSRSQMRHLGPPRVGIAECRSIGLPYVRSGCSR